MPPASPFLAHGEDLAAVMPSGWGLEQGGAPRPGASPDPGGKEVRKGRRKGGRKEGPLPPPPRRASASERAAVCQPVSALPLVAEPDGTN